MQKTTFTALAAAVAMVALTFSASAQTDQYGNPVQPTSTTPADGGTIRSTTTTTTTTYPAGTVPPNGQVAQPVQTQPVQTQPVQTQPVQTAPVYNSQPATTTTTAATRPDGTTEVTRTTRAAEYSKVRMGLFGGLNVGYVRSDSKGVTNQNAGIGATYGLMIDFGIADNYAFTTGLEVTHQNVSIRIDKLLVDKNKDENFDEKDVIDSTGPNVASAQNFTFKYRNQYIGVPLLFKMRTNEIGYFTYYAVFGLEPQVLIRTRANAEGDYTQLNGFFTEEADLVNPNRKGEGTDGNILPFSDFDDNITPLRVALVLGGGAEYSLGGSTRVYTGLRFNNGFTDISRDADYKLRNSYFQLQLGLFF